MSTISINDASADLAGLIARVANGEEFTIVRQDRAVARLIAATIENVNRSEREAIIARLREIGKGRFLGDINIKELIEEGRM